MQKITKHSKVTNVSNVSSVSSNTRSSNTRSSNTRSSNTRSDAPCWRQNKTTCQLANTKEFSVTSNIVNDRPVYHIKWESHPVPAHVYKSIAAYFRRNDNYARISDAQLEAIKTMVADICKYNSAHVTVEQVVAIRSIVLKEKIIMNYPRMNKNIKEMLSEYSRGKDILEISVKYDFAPLNLLRGLLIARGESSSSMYSVFALKVDPSTVLTGHDLEQYLIACANDAESTFNQQAIAKIAFDNEAIVVNYFKSLGIRIKDQEELVAEQIKSHGRAMLTPDILFQDTVFVNGKRCHWIDYKDYIGTKVGFLYSSNCAQAEKYNAAWGEGALAYHHAFVTGVKIPHAQLLDCRSIPVKLDNSIV